jgi:hypothetical protein
MTTHVLTARRHHARIRFPGLYRLLHKAPELQKRTPLQEVATPYQRADTATLQRVLAGLRALPDKPAPVATSSLAPFGGSSLAGLPVPDGVVAVKETGQNTVTFPAVQAAPEAEPWTSIGIRGADNRLRCAERLAGTPVFDGPGIDKNTGTKYVAILLGAGQSDAAEPGDQWEVATDSPSALTHLALAVIEAIPELTSGNTWLEQILFAAQNALNAQTNGGPSVERAGDESLGGAL